VSRQLAKEMSLEKKAMEKSKHLEIVAEEFKAMVEAADEELARENFF